MNFGLRYIFLVQEHAKKMLSCHFPVAVAVYSSNFVNKSCLFSRELSVPASGVIDFIHQATSRNFEGGKTNKCLVKMLMTMSKVQSRNHPNILR